jgi:predicted N-acetyltransferase YhbS
MCVTADISFRAAVAEDIPKLHALVESAYRGESARRGWTHEADLLDGQRSDTDALSLTLADGANRILLAIRGDEVVGCVTVTDKSEGLAYLGMLSVAPHLQAAGLGRQLITRAECVARDEFGSDNMEMTVIAQRTDLVAYYERRGYRQTGEGRPFPHDDPRVGLPTRRDLSFVVMARSLLQGSGAE